MSRGTATLGYMHWYLEALRKFATFRGRSRRREFWTFYGTNMSIWLGLGIIGVVTGGEDDANNPWGLAGAAFYLVVFVPMLAVCVRRLHDTGRSGSTLLINLLPIIGWLFFLSIQAKDGDRGSNKYGDDPKAS